MRVRPEVSELSNEGSIRLNGFNVPALTVRRTETTVELGSGQSFMIAGLLRNHNTNSIDRAPFLGNIPILGALFRSTRYQRAETELVIVVTPYLVRPVSNPNQIALPTDGYRNPDEAQRLLIGQGNDGRSGEQRPGPTVAPARTVAPGDRPPATPTPAAPHRAPPARETRAAAAPPPQPAVGPARLQLLMTARAGKDRTMSRLITLAAVSALALTAGCAAQPRTLTPANNTSLYSLHQPVVEHTNFVFDVASRRRRRLGGRAGAGSAPGSTRSGFATATASRSTSRAATNSARPATTSPGSRRRTACWSPTPARR